MKYKFSAYYHSEKLNGKRSKIEDKIEINDIEISETDNVEEIFINLFKKFFITNNLEFDEFRFYCNKDLNINVKYKKNTFTLRLNKLIKTPDSMLIIEGTNYEYNYIKHSRMLRIQLVPILENYPIVFNYSLSLIGVLRHNIYEKEDFIICENKEDLLNAYNNYNMIKDDVIKKYHLDNIVNPLCHNIDDYPTGFVSYKTINSRFGTDKKLLGQFKLLSVKEYMELTL